MCIRDSDTALRPRPETTIVKDRQGAPNEIGVAAAKRRRKHVRRPPEEPRPAHGATKIYDSRGPAPQAQEELPVLRGFRRTAPVAAK